MGTHVIYAVMNWMLIKFTGWIIKATYWGDMKDIFRLKLKGNMFTATPIRPIEKNPVVDPSQTVRHHQLVAKSYFWAAAMLTPTLTCVRLMHKHGECFFFLHLPTAYISGAVSTNGGQRVSHDVRQMQSHTSGLDVKLVSISIRENKFKWSPVNGSVLADEDHKQELKTLSRCSGGCQQPFRSVTFPTGQKGWEGERDIIR